MTQALIILNDGPETTERSYNGLRLALGLASTDGTSVRIFLIGDAVACARAELVTAAGPYPVGRTLRILVKRGAEVGVCGTCLDARSIPDADLLDGVRRSTITELAEWTLAAERVLVF